MGIKSVIVGGRTDVKKVTIDGATIFEKSGGLPSGFQRCEYVASPGAPYISLPWHYAGKARMEIGLKTGSGTVRICGVVENSGSTRFSLTRTSNTAVTFYYTANGTWQSKGCDMDLDYHEYAVEIEAGAKAKIYRDGVLIETANYNADNYTTTNLFIVFGEWYNTGRRYAGETELHYLRLFGPSGALEVDLVPCYWIADGVIGLYDLCGNVVSSVTGTPFFVNEGSGSFTKGADVN